MLASYPEAYKSLVAKSYYFEPTWKHALRWLFTFALLAMNYVSFQRRSFFRLSLFLTFWTQWLTLIYVAFVCLVQSAFLNDVKVRGVATLHEITMTMNVFVMLIYWPLLYQTDIAKPDNQNDTVNWVMAHLNHSIPFLVVAVNHLISKTQVFSGNGLIFVPLSIAYMIMSIYA